MDERMQKVKKKVLSSFLPLPIPHSSTGRKEASGCHCDPGPSGAGQLTACGSKLSPLCLWFIEQRSRGLQLSRSRRSILHSARRGLNCDARRQPLFKCLGMAEASKQPSCARTRWRWGAGPGSGLARLWVTHSFPRLLAWPAASHPLLGSCAPAFEKRKK